MELKPGYKRTEVGVIPEEWNTSTVGHEFEIKLGKMLDEQNNRGVMKPYLGNKAVQWGRIETDALSTMAMSPSDLNRFRLRRGDLLVCEGGEVGRAAIWQSPIDECYYQKALHRLRPVRGFDTRVMAALLRYWADHGLLANYVTQTSIAHLTRERFAEVPMPVPCPEEQQAISGVLGDVDALLGQLDRLVAKKRDLKQATMQQLLTGKTRLPGFHGEWEVSPLRSFVRNFIVPMRDKPKRLTGDIPWCRIEDFEGMYLTDSKSDQRVDTETIRAMNLKVYPAGTLLVSCSADLGRCAIVARPLVSNQTFIGLEMDDQLASNVFFYYLMTSKADELNNVSSGTTISYLSRGQFEEFAVLAPLDKHEQTAIAAVLSDMDAEIAALEQRLEKIRAIKQGMMQELLTGRIRLV